MTIEPSETTSSEIQSALHDSALTLTVTSGAELKDAVKSMALTGGTIYLEPSETPYNISLYQGGNSDFPITITSASAETPAVVSAITLESCEGLTFQGLVVDSSSVADTRASHLDDMRIKNCSDITITDTQFTSTSEGMLSKDGTAIKGEDLGTVLDTTGFVFTGNSVDGYVQGMMIKHSTDSVFSDNIISHMQGDGLRLVGVVDTLIEGNTFKDFLGSTQEVNHDDMIQVWTTDAEQATENLTIRGNVFSADTAATQTIFIRDESGRGDTADIVNVLIEDNVIYNGSGHGIAVLDAESVTIRNNTLLWNPEAISEMNDDPSLGTSYTPTITGRGVDFEITGNIATKVKFEGEGTVEDNPTISYSNPYADDYWTAHFANPYSSSAEDMRMLIDSPLNGYGAKSTEATVANSDEDLVPVIRQSPSESDYFEVLLDARASLYLGGAVDPNSVRAIWTFEDGTVLEGVEVAHTFADASKTKVTLELIHEDGQATLIEVPIEMDDPLVANISFSDGAVVSDGGTKAAFSYDEDALQQDGFVLDGDSQFSLDRSNTALFNLHEFSLSIDLARADVADEGGKFLDFHHVMGGSIYADGTLKVSIQTEDGWFSVTSDVAVFDDTDMHTLVIRYNDGTNSLVLESDGENIGNAEATGQTMPADSHHMVIGSNWSTSFKGTLGGVTFSKSSNADTTDLEAEVDDVALGYTSNALETAIQYANLSFSEILSNDTFDLQAPDNQTDPINDLGALNLGEGTTTNIDRSETWLHELESFTLALDLARADEQDGGGKFLNFHDVMGARITAEGAVKFSLKTDDGWSGLVSQDGLVADTDAHRILISYDGDLGSLALYVDGQEMDQVQATGQTAAMGSHDLIIGAAGWQKDDQIDALVDDFGFWDTGADANWVALDYATFILEGSMNDIA